MLDSRPQMKTLARLLLLSAFAAVTSAQCLGGTQGAATSCWVGAVVSGGANQGAVVANLGNSYPINVTNPTPAMTSDIGFAYCLSFTMSCAAIITTTKGQ